MTDELIVLNDDDFESEEGKRGWAEPIRRVVSKFWEMKLDLIAGSEVGGEGEITVYFWILTIITMIQHHPPQSPRTTLPTMYDLPSEDPEEMGLPDEFHDFQPKLLRETCQPRTQEDFFIGADLNLYYDLKHTNWYKRPDWFLVLGVPASQSQAELRWSYVMWQEGTAPFLVVELLSPGTEAEDLGQTLRVIGNPPTKWQVYEQILRIPYYAVFDRSCNQFRLFCLQGSRYEEIEVPSAGFWFPELELGLGLWSGQYTNVTGQWLRWYDQASQWIPTDQERADREAQRAEQESQRADREAQRANKLAAKLREMGIEEE